MGLVRPGPVDRDEVFIVDLWVGNPGELKEARMLGTSAVKLRNLLYPFNGRSTMVRSSISGAHRTLRGFEQQCCTSGSRRQFRCFVRHRVQHRSSPEGTLLRDVLAGRIA